MRRWIVLAAAIFVCVPCAVFAQPMAISDFVAGMSSGGFEVSVADGCGRGSVICRADFKHHSARVTVSDAFVEVNSDGRVTGWTGLVVKDKDQARDVLNIVSAANAFVIALGEPEDEKRKLLNTALFKRVEPLACCLVGAVVDSRGARVAIRLRKSREGS
jgi:hypothetical protein